MGAAMVGVTINSPVSQIQLIDALGASLRSLGGLVTRTASGLHVSGGSLGVNFAFTAKTEAQFDVRQVAPDRFEVTGSLQWSPAAVVWICMVVGFFIFGILWLVGLLYLFYNPTQAYQACLLGLQNSVAGTPAAPPYAPPAPQSRMPVPPVDRSAYQSPGTILAPAGAAYAVGGPTLRVSLNGLPLSALPITPGSNYSIGRNVGSGIMVGDPMVSGTHATLAVHSDGEVGITDAGSSNGTFVNGERVSGEHRPLKSGDEVVLGSSNCRLGFELP